MNTDVIKRNYLHFTLLLLKEKTSEKGTHLSAKGIIEHFKETYGLAPNRKTIYTVMDDLKAMGYDVNLEKNRAELGYYLGHRSISSAQLHLLVDGIESLDDVKADDKRDIEERLCQELGYSFDKLNIRPYEKRNQGNSRIDEEVEDDESALAKKPLPQLDKIQIILEAIAKNKQITFTGITPNVLMADLLCDIGEEERALFLKEAQPIVSPYEVLRNRNNELCLLYSLTVKGQHYPCFSRIAPFSDIALTSKPRPRTFDESIFPADISNYGSAQEYKASQQLTPKAVLPTQGRERARQSMPSFASSYIGLLQGQSTINSHS